MNRRQPRVLRRVHSRQSLRADGRPKAGLHRAAAFPVAALLVFFVPIAADAGELKAGWTPQLLASESDDCTEALVQGAWENTKREQGVDPAMQLTSEIRKQLEPQIASMKTLCACAVRAGAERYTKAEVDKSPADLDSFLTETIAKGVCTLSP